VARTANLVCLRISCACQAQRAVADRLSCLDAVFLDAPHVMRGTDAKHVEDPLAVTRTFPDTNDPEQMLRAWYTADDKSRYRGIERTIPYLRDFLAHEKPFNVRETSGTRPLALAPPLLAICARAWPRCLD